MLLIGCLGRFVRLLFVLVLIVVLVGGWYYFTKLHPEKAPWKGGLATVQDKVATAKLGAEVKAALSLRESLKGADIDVSAERDVVTLRGTVASTDLSKTAETVAASV